MVREGVWVECKLHSRHETPPTDISDCEARRIIYLHSKRHSISDGVLFVHYLLFFLYMSWWLFGKMEV